MFAPCTVASVGRSEGSVLPVPRETAEPRVSATGARGPGRAAPRSQSGDCRWPLWLGRQASGSGWALRGCFSFPKPPFTPSRYPSPHWLTQALSPAGTVMENY